MDVTLPISAGRIAGRPHKSIAVEPVPSGETRLIVIDARRRFIRASDAGADMLRKETGLRLRMDQVCAISQIDDARLARAVSQADQGFNIEQTLPIGPKGAGLSLSVVAMPGLDRDLEIILLVRDAREDRRRALLRAAALFGFTTAETRLVTALCDGCSVPDAAGRLGVAPTTARTHLQNVFAKTGVRRQGDLLTLVSHPGVSPSWAFA